MTIIYRIASTTLGVLILTVLLVSSVLLIRPSSAFALSGSDFRADWIIDDYLFYTGDTMSLTEIQDFLNAKRPTCDTNGQTLIYDSAYGDTVTRAVYSSRRGVSTPFICLNQFTQSYDGKSDSGLCAAMPSGTNRTSAQIIDDVARACNISEKVLIVLLQKEQALVTDDWPWPIQYTKATGYYCPDDPNNPGWCHPDYAGFFNQVYNAARQFNRYRLYPENYNYAVGRTSFVSYQANAPSCGGTNLTMRTAATAGLYNYTPYQPNAAALNNLYGLGDGCSAYGNRNFWRMYNDWFGSTHGSLIRTTTSGALFYRDNNMRFSVPSMALVEQYGLGLKDVRFVSQQEMDSIPLASGPFSSSLGQVVKSDSDGDSDGGALYLVSRGYKIPIQSLEQFNSLGFTSEDITYLPLSTILRIIPSNSGLSNYVQAPDLSVSRIVSGEKRSIFELSKLTELNPSGNITPLSNFTLSTWSSGAPEVDGNYLIIGPDSGIRLYKSTNYHSVPSMGVYECWNLKTLKTFKIKSYSSIGGGSSGNLGCLAEDSIGNEYIMSGNARYPIPEGHSLTTPTYDDSLINRISLGTLKPVIKGSGPALATYEGGQKRPIPTMSIYSELGFDSTSITTLSQSAYNSIPTGPTKLSMGTLILEPNGAISVVTATDKRRYVVSVTQFEYFGFSWNRLLRLSGAGLAGYTSDGNLPYYIKVGSNVFLIDARVRYLIDSSLDDHLGIDRTTIPSLDQRIISNTLPWNMTRFIKHSTDNSVYYLENGTKRPISSWQRVEQLGGADKIIVISKMRVDSFPTGPAI